jgi:hypothetical protein
MKEGRKIFCIKIMDREALLVLYTLGRTVAFPMTYYGWFFVFF